MRDADDNELSQVDGGNFWDGVFCGMGIVLIGAEMAGSAVTAGMSDIAMAGTIVKTAQSCSNLF